LVALLKDANEGLEQEKKVSFFPRCPRALGFEQEEKAAISP
jgi:hypothetical protein